MRDRCTFHRQGDPRVCGRLRSEHPGGGQRKPIGEHVWRHDKRDEWRLDIAFRVVVFDPTPKALR